MSEMSLKYKLLPVSGFTLFYKNMIQCPEISNLSPVEKSTVIFNLWNDLGPVERKRLIERAHIENDIKQELINMEDLETSMSSMAINTVYPTDRCCICLSNEAVVLFNPCGHISYCTECLGDSFPTLCAVCRSTVESITDVSNFRSSS